MTRYLSRAIAAGALVAGELVACNAVLDNKPGILVEQAEAQAPLEAPTEAPPDAAARDADTAPHDGAPPPVVPIDGGDGTPECPDGHHFCHGACAADTDPAFGCGDDDCEPCALPRALAACDRDRCVVHTCDPGFADCNGKPRDGCETDLSDTKSCGACGVACPATAPVCAPAVGVPGIAFACVTGCAPETPSLCDGECVDTATHVEHCGGCGIACPGTAREIPACLGGACTFTCAAGWANCNLLAADGCEANLSNDPNHCGLCGQACVFGGCHGGACGLFPGPGGDKHDD